jgi:hypothetical protein
VTTKRMSAVKNNEPVVKDEKSGLELSSYVPTDLNLPNSSAAAPNTFRL